MGTWLFLRGSKAPILYENKASAVTPDERYADFQYARKSLQTLLDRASSLVETALDHAEDGQARDIEVASGAIGQAANVAKELVTLHKTISDIEKPVTNNTQINIEKQQVVNLTTAELLNQLEAS